MSDDRDLRDPEPVHEIHRLAHLPVRCDGDELGGLAIGCLQLESEYLLDRRRGRSALDDPVFPEPVVVVELREVAATPVRDERYDGAFGPVALSHFQHGPYGRAARPAHEEPFFAGEPPGGQEGVAVGDGHVFVHDRGVKGLRPEVFADPLDEVGVRTRRRVDRPLGIRAHDEQVGLALLEEPSRPGDRSSGS